MASLVNKAHWQFLGLVMAVLALILTAATSGMNDWRVWYMEDMSVFSDSMVWVGVWRACFYSHVHDTFEVCQSISITDSFVPPEIAAAQVLCMIAIPMGIAANLLAGYAVRHVYFNVNPNRITWVFSLAGALYLITATCSLVPVIWNTHSVLENRTIDFPPEFSLPAAPHRQVVGLGVVMGFASSLMLIVSGLLFLVYRQPVKVLQKPSSEAEDTEGQSRGNTDGRTDEFLGAIAETGEEGIDNPVFKAEEKA
ncbi:claudin-34-like [Astyanax mexicanus]|uniref:Claudin-34-like n=1 Tax=Astyanax mexicanus TaxID=7994 RepID=A0A8T2M0Z0_ASTMX|nr:claudin-34-like [Astyanax mexicanus]